MTRAAGDAGGAWENTPSHIYGDGFAKFSLSIYGKGGYKRATFIRKSRQYIDKVRF